MIKTSPSERHWYILYTLTRHEKKVKQLLEKSQVESYLPLHFIWRQWSDRKKRVEVPLFSNYVFIKSSLKGLYNALQIPGVLRYLSNSDGPERIDDLQIRFIKNILKDEVQVTSHFLNEGDKVEFVSGPFQGLQGILLRSTFQKEVAVEIKQLNSTIIIKKGSYELEKIDEFSYIH